MDLPHPPRKLVLVQIKLAQPALGVSGGESPYGHLLPGARTQGCSKVTGLAGVFLEMPPRPGGGNAAIRPPVNAAGLASMSMASSALASIYVTGVTELLRSVWPGQVAEASQAIWPRSLHRSLSALDHLANTGRSSSASRICAVQTTYGSGL